MDFITLFTIFVLACVVGWCLIWGVTPALHTPLMAVTNALSGVVAVAAIYMLGTMPADLTNPAFWCIFVALCLTSVNIFGGFAVAERMLVLFKAKKPASGKNTPKEGA